MATRRIKLAWVLGASLAVLVFLGFLAPVLIARRWSAFRQEVEAELAEIRASGQPASAEDWSWFYPRPAPDKDMTKPVLDALALLPKESADRPSFQVMVDDWDEFGPPDKWPAKPAGRAAHAKPADVAKSLRDNRRCIDALEQAATKQGSARYPLDEEPDNVGEDRNHIRNLLAAAYLLRLSANESVEQGNARRAGLAIVAILGLGRSLERKPLLISLLARHVIENIGCEAVAHCIPRIPLSSEDLAAFDKALAHADEKIETQRALSGERLMAIVAAQQIFRDQSASGVVGRAAMQEDQHDFAQLLRYRGEELACVGRSWAEQSHDLQQLEDRWDKILAQESLPLTNMSRINLNAVLEKCEIAIGRKKEARILIAVERYRRDHHALPQRLESLVPHFIAELPQDPFSEKPFLWFADDQGLVVYSVGPNAADEHAKGDDIALRVKYSKEQMGRK
jgi:hypothetical protein